MPTTFEHGYNDAENKAAALIEKVGNHNRAIDKLNSEVVNKATGTLGKIDYAIGELRFYKEAKLPIAEKLSARVVAQLREMADRLEAKVE